MYKNKKILIVFKKLNTILSKINYNHKLNKCQYDGMVDLEDSKSFAARRAGSSPATGTTY